MTPHQDLMAAYLAKRETLTRFLAARLGSRAAADDALQELFLKIAAVDPQAIFERPDAMVFRMAANLAVDLLRQRRRAEIRDQAWRDVQGDDGDRTVSPERAWSAQRRLADLIESLERLPPRMHQAFRLCKLEEKTREEAAQQMGISVKAVEKHITAALKALTWLR